MPKSIRGHHSTKRRATPRSSMMREGAKPIRYKSCGDRIKFAPPSTIENRLPLDDQNNSGV